VHDHVVHRPGAAWAGVSCRGAGAMDDMIMHRSQKTAADPAGESAAVLPCWSA